MANESVAGCERVEAITGKWAHSGHINMRDLLLEIAISDGMVGESTMRDYANLVIRWAKSIMIVARARGDNDEDAPGTYDDAIAGAEFFLHLSEQLHEAAPKMKKGQPQ